ncbi:acyl-coenzyme A thioesterase 13-like [Phalaenopsis equestris]|uniref:acyl-coenzyme A thioesterase 13-like n=1 Tax=Phalaenopsis equestris TaxID=78828 RepID=UPI0009E56754|nr:acyl-coenzyme A thioesterase 13-like [Phalaenopsis equestris]
MAAQNPSKLQHAYAGGHPASANSATANIEAAQKLIEGMVAKSPAAGSMDAWNGRLFDAIPLSGLRIKFAGGGRALCSYSIHASVADEEGNWKLGAMASVIDDICVAAILSAVGEFKISVDFSISFFSRAKIGDEVEIGTKIMEDKGRLTAVAVVVRNKKTGRIVASGRQWMSLTRSLHHSHL